MQMVVVVIPGVEGIDMAMVSCRGMADNGATTQPMRPI